MTSDTESVRFRPEADSSRSVAFNNFIMRMEQKPRMHPYSYSISLRAWHPSMDPDAITRGLDKVPTRTCRAGDARSTPKGTPLEGTYKETYWYSELIPTDGGASIIEGLEDRLSYLAHDLSPRSEFISSLRASGGRVELFIGLYGDRNFGFELPPQTVATLAAIGLALSFDIYPGPS